MKPDFALTRDQRDEILKAVNAIERQLEEMSRSPEREARRWAGTPPWQGFYVISTNLAIIRMNAANMRGTTSN
jgi:hypothetical protein